MSLHFARRLVPLLRDAYVALDKEIPTESKHVAIAYIRLAEAMELLGIEAPE